ncbi:MAG: PKD domain-containing protein [Caldilineaceae bacterium]
MPRRQFGDGTTANAVQVNKQYTAPGIYNVILTLTDSGLVASTNRLINVFAPTPTMTPVLPPTPTPLPPTPTPLPTPTLTMAPTLPPPVEPITPTVPPEIATLTPQVPVDPNATPTPTFDPNATSTPTFDPNATPTVQLVGPTGASSPLSRASVCPRAMKAASRS